ncbi:MAG: sulfatase-like hydrolase/transferase, partial [Victivallaceae bacterium]|nr:sulfatase-like hydrolase/transferase [Victivallaceae bacterium]
MDILQRPYAFLKGKRDILLNWLAVTAFFVLLLVIDNIGMKGFGNRFLQGLWFCLLMGAIPVMLPKIAARVYVCVFVPLFGIVSMVSSALRYHFALQIDGDIFAVLAATSPKEIQEFVGYFYGFWTIAILLVFFVAITAATVLLFRRPWRFSVFGAILGFAMLLPYGARFAYIYGSGKDRTKPFRRNLALNLCSGYYMYNRDFHALTAMAQSPAVPGNIALDPKARDMVGVIVLGESASRKHLGLYGYSRNTCPLLSGLGDGVIAYDDVLAAIQGTTRAVRYLFTQSTIKDKQNPRCTLFDILKRAGYDISLFSNQWRWGRYDGPIGVVFAHVDESVYVRETHGKSTGFDEDLLPYLRNAIGKTKDASGPKLVLLHLTGSHTKAKSRYPADFGP